MLWYEKIFLHGLHRWWWPMLATNLRCWRQIWDVGDSLGVFSPAKDVINIEILSATPKNCYQDKFTNIHLSPTSMYPFALCNLLKSSVLFLTSIKCFSFQKQRHISNPGQHQVWIRNLKRNRARLNYLFFHIYSKILNRKGMMEMMTTKMMKQMKEPVNNLVYWAADPFTHLTCLWVIDYEP